MNNLRSNPLAVALISIIAILIIAILLVLLTPRPTNAPETAITPTPEPTVTEEDPSPTVTPRIEPPVSNIGTESGILNNDALWQELTVYADNSYVSDYSLGEGIMYFGDLNTRSVTGQKAVFTLGDSEASIDNIQVYDAETSNAFNSSLVHPDNMEDVIKFDLGLTYGIADLSFTYNEQTNTIYMAVVDNAYEQNIQHVFIIEPDNKRYKEIYLGQAGERNLNILGQEGNYLGLNYNNCFQCDGEISNTVILNLMTGAAQDYNLAGLIVFDLPNNSAVIEKYIDAEEVRVKLP